MISVFSSSAVIRFVKIVVLFFLGLSVVFISFVFSLFYVSIKLWSYFSSISIVFIPLFRFYFIIVIRFYKIIVLFF